MHLRPSTRPEDTPQREPHALWNSRSQRLGQWLGALLVLAAVLFLPLSLPSCGSDPAPTTPSLYGKAAGNVVVLDTTTEALYFGMRGTSYTFSTTASKIASLQPGNIIVGRLKGGFAAWVDGVSKTDVYEVQTHPAQLTDIFQEAEIHISRPVFTAGGTQPQSRALRPTGLPPSSLSPQFTWPWDLIDAGVNDNLVSSFAVQEKLWSRLVQINPNTTAQANLWFVAGYDLMPTVNLDISIKDFSIKSATVMFAGRADAYIGFEADAQVAITPPDLKLINHQFDPIAFEVGPIPVAIVPSLVVTAHTEATFNASASLIVSKGFDFQLGSTYDGTNWNHVHSITPIPLEFTKRASVNASGKVQLNVALTLKIFHSTLTATVSPYARFNWDPINIPHWQVFGGICGEASANLSVFSKTAQYQWGPQGPLCDEWTLYQSNSGVIMSTITPSSTTVSTGGTQQFQAQVTSGSAGDTSTAWTTDFGTISASGLFTAPTSTVVAHITATSNADATQTASAVVNVIALPTIQSFTAASNPIGSGSRALLTPVFTGGTGFIDQGVGSVTSNTTVATGALTSTTTFTLSVTNNAGATAQLPLTVSTTQVTVLDPIANPTAWQLNGNAAIDTVNKLIILTTSGPNQAGSIFYTTPIPMSAITIIYDALADQPSQIMSPPWSQGADGLALVLGDTFRGATSTSLGYLGTGLGMSGIGGFALAQRMYQGSCGEPSANFIYWTDPSTWNGTCYTVSGQVTANLPVFLGNLIQYKVQLQNGQLTVWINGNVVTGPTAVQGIPTNGLLGFSGGTGGSYERHTIQNLSVTSP